MFLNNDSLIARLVFSTGLFIILSLFSGCGEDLIAARKTHCKSYLKLGDLQGETTDQCVSNKDSYRKAATKYSENMLENIYPSFLQAKSLIDSSFEKFDQKGFLPLPLETELPIVLFDEAEIKKSWRYFVDLDNVWFWEPSAEESQLGWSISGNRSSTEKIETLSLAGIAPNSIKKLGDTCSIVSSSKSVIGCSTRVFLDMTTDSYGMSEIIVIGLSFIPPSKEAALKIILASELDAWDATSQKK